MTTDSAQGSIQRDASGRLVWTGNVIEGQRLAIVVADDFGPLFGKVSGGGFVARRDLRLFIARTVLLSPWCIIPAASLLAVGFAAGVAIGGGA